MQSTHLTNVNIRRRGLGGLEEAVGGDGKAPDDATRLVLSLCKEKF